VVGNRWLLVPPAQARLTGCDTRSTLIEMQKTA